ncbi:hypothetical protein M433DRAFT_132668 [Acidomyces richmondensis BFW]|nr:MAG: hypothetical protein FE78DRAFT_67831 [Acidomyces sp. 'richmondensis']KYG47812.1 hypothetical protein M433DRAFT_132668 [Acidomyces richmondensis BFW]
MADTVADLLSFPPDNVATLSPRDYDQQINEYIKQLSKVPKSFYTKPVDKKNILEFLNPSVNTITYAIALLEQVKAGNKSKAAIEKILNNAILFFSTFDPVQARYAADFWMSLLDWTLDQLTQLVPVNFSPVSTAWLRLDPSAGTFTSFHIRFLRACVSCGVPSQALPILDKNIYAFPVNLPKSTLEELPSDVHELSSSIFTPKSGFTAKITCEQVLEYYLVGAHVYIGQRNYSRARLFLESVLLMPSQQHAVSALQVEAYKRWVLIGLLAEGKSYPIPRTSDPQVIKAIRAVAKPYEALVEDFEKRDWQKYQAEMDVGTQVWYEDGNLSLVKEVGDALLRRRVLDLQKTYAALPMSRVALHLGLQPEQVLQLVTDMIRQKYVHASITPGVPTGESVLRFQTTGISSSNSIESDYDLQAQTKRIEELLTFIRDTDRRVQLSKDFADHQKRVKRNGGPDGDLADQMDLSWEFSGAGFDDGDEDIMAA